MCDIVLVVIIIIIGLENTVESVSQLTLYHFKPSSFPSVNLFQSLENFEL